MRSIRRGQQGWKRGMRRWSVPGFFQKKLEYHLISGGPVPSTEEGWEPSYGGV